MRIGILGTGNIGKAMAAAIADSGHQVMVGSRNADRAELVAKELQNSGRNISGANNSDTIAASEIIILAVPYSAATEILSGVDVAGKVIIDVTNPLNEDFSELTIGCITSAAEEIQGSVPDASVVKAFNTVFAQIYADNAPFGQSKVPVFVAADDAKAKGLVTKLVETCGFDAIDAGCLKTARYLEPLAGLNIKFGYGLGWGTSISPAWLKG